MRLFRRARNAPWPGYLVDCPLLPVARSYLDFPFISRYLSRYMAKSRDCISIAESLQGSIDFSLFFASQVRI